MEMKRKLCSVVLGILMGNALGGGYETLPESPWLVYLGVFGGYHHAAYRYESLYRNTLPRSQLFKNEIWQYGSLWGAHVGLQYHFVHPCYIELNFAGMSNSRKARFNASLFTDPVSTMVPNIDTTLRLKYNVDLTGVFGVDITPALRIYVKGGGAYAKLVQDFAVLQSTMSGSVSQQQKTRHNLWGVVLGVGMSRNLYRWISLFAEYDFYDYGNHQLNTIRHVSIDPIVPQPDSYTQEAKNIRAYTVRAGLNVNFNL